LPHVRPGVSEWVSNSAKENNNTIMQSPSRTRRASVTKEEKLSSAPAGQSEDLNLNPQGRAEGTEGATCFSRDHPLSGCPSPPPDLSEETLLAPEHTEVLAKMRFISMLVDTIIGVARSKAAPLTALNESHLPLSGPEGPLEGEGPLQRRLHQLLLYMRCLQLLSQTLDYARSELKNKRLKPSTSVKNTLAILNERFRHSLSMSKMLNAENVLGESGITPADTTVYADKLLYQYAIEQCQSAALDELFNNPGECVQRYQAAHVILHALQSQTSSQDDKNTLIRYKDAVEKRLQILEEQGYVYAYDAISN